jgi:hypothetical protein
MANRIYQPTLFQLPLVRNSQLLTSFSPAGSQYLTAIGSFHSLSEAVNALSASIMRLKSTFHFVFIFYLYYTKTPSVLCGTGTFLFFKTEGKGRGNYLKCKGVMQKKCFTR